ncbi:MAG: ferritin family protein [Planctomycetes bacterium]|nr:ferritin family protein [Planctomycetota bacterium]
MEFESMRDILNFALSKEHASEQFYLNLADQMKDAVTQAVFRNIAKQERKHAEELELEFIKHGYTLSSVSGKDSDYQWQEQLELDEQAKNMNYSDALTVAIQKERAAFQLYTQLVGMTNNIKFRDILLQLAEEEMRHVIQFEHEYDAVLHHKE